MTRKEWKKAWPGGSWISPARRLAIYLRDRFVCQLCGRDLHDADACDVTLDHSRPRSRGGSHEATNLFTCCKSCNCSRQDLSVVAFLRRRYAEILVPAVTEDDRMIERAARSKRASISAQMRRPITRQIVLARAIIRGDVNRAEIIDQHR